MITPRKISNGGLTPLAWLAMSAALLGGCVAQVRVANPPPRVYAAPPPSYMPPPAYGSAPSEEEMQASEAPPPLPEYEQPPCPEEGYLWTPGYWAYGGAGYYWVPGTWVQPPQVGVLWTPGYWGFSAGLYAFHPGYWGPSVGFYGGVNYGYGYGGVGFAGGRWVGRSFAYNRSVNNVNVTVIHNTYNETVINHSNNRVSYNGGRGGVAAAPTVQERAAAQERHAAPTSMQRQHLQQAAANPALAAHANGGHPGIAATPRPAAFNGPGVVGAHGAVAGPARAPAAEPPRNLGTAPHAAGLPAAGQPNAVHAAPSALHAPPAAGRPAAAGAHPPAASAQPGAKAPPPRSPHPKAPEDKKREPQGGNK